MYVVGIADRHGVDNDSHETVLAVPVHFDEVKKIFYGKFIIMRAHKETMKGVLAISNEKDPGE